MLDVPVVLDITLQTLLGQSILESENSLRVLAFPPHPAMSCSS